MLLKFPLIRLNTQQKQRVLFYGCISGVATVLSIVIWNVAFAGSSSGSTRGAAPTEKILIRRWSFKSTRCVERADEQSI